MTRPNFDEWGGIVVVVFTVFSTTTLGATFAQATCESLYVHMYCRAVLAFGFSLLFIFPLLYVVGRTAQTRDWPSI